MSLPAISDIADAPTEGEGDFGANVVTWMISQEVFVTELRAWTVALNTMGFGWLDGSGAPDAGQGLLGERYLDYSTGDVYRKYAGGWVWIMNLRGPAADTSVLIAKALGTTKGDLLAFSAAATPARLPAGADGQLLTADSTQPLGVTWADAPASGINYWNASGAFTRVSDATFTVIDDVANQDVFRVGRPIRFRQNSGTAWQYAMVRSYAAGTVTLGGAALTAAIGADAGREMAYGDMARLHTETLVFSGNFADGADSTLVLNDLLARMVWPKGKSYLVHFMIRPKVDDSGATQPRMNVLLNGSAVASTANGVAIVDTAWTETTTDVLTANYGITLGQSVEVSVYTTGCTGGGTNSSDAHDLTMVMTFVQE